MYKPLKVYNPDDPKKWRMEDLAVQIMADAGSVPDGETDEYWSPSDTPDLRRGGQGGYSSLGSHFFTYKEPEPGTELQTLLSKPCPTISEVLFFGRNFKADQGLWGEFLMPGELSMISAHPWAGKSTFARIMAKSVALGEDLLDYPTRKSRVLLLSLETGIVRLSRFLMRDERVTPELDNWLKLFVCPIVEKDLTAEIELFGNLLNRFEPDLVIVDMLADMFGIEDFNSYAEFAKISKPLRSIAVATKAHICFTHHLNKVGGTLGTTRILGSVDFALELKRDGNKDVFVSTAKTRYDTMLDKVQLILHRETDTYTTILSDTEQLDILSEVRQYVEAHSPTTRTEIRQALQRRKSDVNDAVKHWVAFGVFATPDRTKVKYIVS